MNGSDTSERALAIQTAILKKMSGEDRLQLAFQLSETVRSLSAARLREQYPGMPDKEFLRRFIQCVLPPEQIPPVLR